MTPPLKKPRTKSLTKSKTAEVRQIDTTLMNKDEVFRMLCLAEVTGLPLLLIGPPGVGKTKAVLEYSKSWMAKNLDKTNQKAINKFNEEFLNKIFILETDEGTKSSEIKGMPDMGALFTQNKYELLAPVTEAEVVVINEIDKASTNIRNALLGIMNEKFLFSGKLKLFCKWKLFIGTCNIIPKDEMGSPFWDRFVLKMTVNRITAGEIQRYFIKGGRNFRETFNLGIPNRQEMDTITIAPDKLEKFIDVCYTDCSDRTLTFVPNLVKAVAYIWNESVDAALVKVASLMVTDNAAAKLKEKLLSPAMKKVLAKVDMLKTTKKQEEVDLIVKEIGTIIANLASTGELNQTDVNDVENTINYVLDNHELEQDQELEEVFTEDEEPIEV